MLVAVAVALLAPAVAGAAFLPADTTAVLSGQPDLLTPFATPAGDAKLQTDQSIDRAGDKIVFTSTSDGLVADDDDSVSNVYVENLATGAIQLVSRRTGANGAPSHADCSQGAISADGNAVAFVCRGSLGAGVPEDTAADEVYLRDLSNQTTVLVSRAANGSVDNAADDPAISADGSFVAFLGSDSTPDAVFRRDVRQGQTAPVTAGEGGFSPDSPSISDDGQRVAFDTDAQLDPTVDNTNSGIDVYVTGFTASTPNPPQLVSRADGNGAIGNSQSDRPIISGDGQWVLFRSFADNLVPADTDHTPNLYSHNINAGVTVLTGFGPGGAKIDDATPTAMSLGGDVAAFTQGGQAFVYGTGHMPADRVDLANGAGGSPLGGVAAVAMDRSGPGGTPQKVVMEVDHGITTDVEPNLHSVVVRSLPGNTTQTVARPPGGAPFVNVGGDASNGSLSADGQFAVLVSSAPAFGVTSDEGTQVLRRDLDTGALTLVSRANGPNGAPLKDAQGAVISGDGRRVAFLADDPDDNGVVHLYVRDVASGATFLADAVDGTSAPVSGLSPSDVSISDDGSRVAFTTGAPLVSGDTGNDADVYVRDLSSGRTFLVDRASGASGAKADTGATEPKISGDGHSVVFGTRSKLDPANDENSFDFDVYVRHIDGDLSTTLASVDAQGRKNDGFPTVEGISRDGSRVLFFDDAQRFGPYASNSFTTRLYVRDLRAGTLTVAGAADGRDIVPLADSDFGNDPAATLSADGQHVAFDAGPDTSIAPGAPKDKVLRLYERDLTAGTTRLTSRRSGAAGAPFDGLPGGGSFSLTADGGCVSFDANANLLPPPGGDDHGLVLMRVVEPNCGRSVPAGSTPPPPRTAPAGPALLSRLSVKPARFFVGGRKGGTKIAFRLDKASAVTLTFSRLLPAHKKGKRCLTTVHKGKRCTVVRVVGRLTVGKGRSGANTVTFSGKLGRHALARGSYRLTATPAHGKAHTATFTVIKAPKAKPKPKPKRGK